MPAGRFDVERFVHPEPGTPGKMVTAEGGFLQDIDRFDAAFFGLSPREARKIDPQHRLLLEVAWEALEDAGIPPSSLAGRRVGVFVGIWSGEYENVMYRTPTELDFHSITGGGRYAASGRISYALDLRGPAVTVDTGCSASLVAVHLARQAILNGEADLAIAGAANLVLQPQVNVGYSRSGMLSAGGRCRFGDAGAAGYVRSDGAAAVVLKPLDRATEDGDRVRGVLLATGVNADGRGSGQLATPSAEAQAELLETVYARAGVDPSTVPYVEAHGTGTRAGDPVELTALGSVLGAGRNPESPLLVGSVKTNIGHTEAAAGMAGLIKTLLALEHRRIPRNLHLHQPHEGIGWADLNVEVPRETRTWPEGAPLVAGVSSFGITGTNAHAVLGAAPERRPNPPVSGASGPVVVAVSGRSPEALTAAAQRLRAHVSTPGVRLVDVAYTSTCRRDHHPYRLAIVAESITELISALDEHLAGQAAALTAAGTVTGEQAPTLAFVFSGQGSQWVGMGRALLGWAPEFTATIDRCDALLRRAAGWSLRETLLSDAPNGLERVDIIQPTLACVQIALAEQLRAWGVHPHAVAGHSMGEVAAAYVAGGLSLEDALRVIVARSRLLAEIAGAGAMALVDLDEAELTTRLQKLDGRVSVAAVNGPRSTVVSGDPVLIDALIATLEEEDVFCRRVKVDVASHSAQTDPLLPRLAAELATLQPMAPTVSFYSTPRPGAPPNAILDASYWVDNLRRPVRLLAAMKSMIERGIDTFIEIAPHPVLLTSLGDIAADTSREVHILGGPRRDEPERKRMLELLARLHVAGVSVDWAAVFPADVRAVQLPSYPWQRERFWLETWEDWGSDSGARNGRAAWPTEASDWLYSLDWVEGSPASERVSHPPSTRWLIVGPAGSLRDSVVRALQAAGQQPIAVRVGDSLIDDTLHARGAAPLGGLVLLPGEPTSPGEAAAMSGCAAATSLIQTVLDGGPSQAPRLLIVTRGAMALPASAPTLDGMFDAPLWGFSRVVRDEHPELDVRLLDLDPNADASHNARSVLEVAFDSSIETDVAVRGGRRWVPRLRRAEAPEPRPDIGAWPTDGATLITGGLGDLGLAVARQLVERGVRRLVLLSRTPMPPRAEWRAADATSGQGRRIAAIMELEARGASVQCAAVDVGDQRALTEFLSTYTSEAWPPIVAVVHTAGVIDSHLVRSLPVDALRSVFHGKVGGAWLLHGAFPQAKRFVFFSSTSVLIPQAGEANYAAANAFLDALSAVRRASGQRAQVVNWGVWRNAGVIANEAGERYVQEVRRQGIDSMDPAVAVQVLDCLAAADTPQIFVAPIDWERLRQTRGAAHLGSVFENLIGAAASRAPGQHEALTELVQLAPGERRGAIESRLRSMAAKVLGVAPERVRGDATLGSQGLDSLMALELRNHIEGAFDLKVSATVAWNYPTLAKLSGYLFKQLEDRLTTLGGAEEAAAAPVVIPVAETPAFGVTAASVHERVHELAGVSDDDILRELRGGA
jgi:acyl transferase domain-containing protein/acyl carrier protein